MTPVVTQVARAIAVGLLAAAIATDREGLTILYAVAFSIGLGEVLVDTASQAAIPQLARPGSLEQADARMVGAQLTSGEGCDRRRRRLGAADVRGCEPPR